jgi:hypothetical protein
MVIGPLIPLDCGEVGRPGRLIHFSQVVYDVAIAEAWGVTAESAIPDPDAALL